jgi:(4-(4-[2-(gamma-L-glutamylamino)ethyl]phenoxymethyl)furan-2-yl)methanamine synthase
LIEEPDLAAVLGLDIGGANTKAALINIQDEHVSSISVVSEYFPVWKNPEKLADVLSALRKKLGGKIDAVGVTMTAELSDAYQTKQEGVNHILSCVCSAFGSLPIYVLTVDGTMETPDFAKQNPLKVASANWAATGWLVAKKLPDCVVVDVGSTSTSIIPISKGKVSAVGKTDLEKLICGELVYTGSLRTNVAAIVQSIPIKGSVAHVSSELFAQSGDVHIILGNITEKEYTSETADGRGKSVPEALARLARVVCADTEMLTKKEIVEMAKYVYEKQLKQITDGLTKVYSNIKSAGSVPVPIVVTGLGKNFLAKAAAKKVGAEKIVDLGTLLWESFVIATPAVGVGLMAAEKNGGKQIQWT